MAAANQTKDSIGKRAWEIYDRKIRGKIESDNFGRFLVIDVESGEFEIGDDDLEVMHRAYAKHPGGSLHLFRIGYPAVGTIGGGLLTPR